MAMPFGSGPSCCRNEPRLAGGSALSGFNPSVGGVIQPPPDRTISDRPPVDPIPSKGVVVGHILLGRAVETASVAERLW